MQWNTGAAGAVNNLAYDNGESVPVPLLGGVPAPYDWSPLNPGIQAGSYSGTLVTNDAAEVVGGSLVVAGKIANQVVVGSNSWWAHEYDNLVIDFGAGGAVATYRCFDTPVAPAGCDQGASVPVDVAFAPLSGNEGAAGTARRGAVFDGTTLSIFHENYSGISGTDIENNFGLNASEVPPPRLLGTLPDVSGDAVADFYMLMHASGSTRVNLHSGADGALLRVIDFFDDGWRPIATDVLLDANGDGVANDPAILLLAENNLTGRLEFEIRSPTTGGVLIPGFKFLNQTWNAVAVAIVPDTNGDGMTDDPAVAVVATKRDGSRSTVEVKRLSDGLLLGKWSVFEPTWTLKDVAAVVSASGDAVLAMLGTDQVTGVSRLQMRRLNDGFKYGVFAFGNQVETLAMSAMSDKDGNGTDDDFALAVLGKKASGSHIARFIALDTLTKIKDIRVTGNKWIIDDLALLPDINSNGFDEVVGLGRGVSTGSVLIKIRDFNTAATLHNLFL